MIENKTQMGKNSRYHVPNLERALGVMELLSHYNEGLSLSEIVQKTKLPKNSIFRITMTLLNFGYLFRDEDSKRFTLTRKLLTLGSAAMSEYSLVEKSLDVMRQLRDVVKETVLIGTIAQNEGIALEQVLGTHPFKFTADAGLRIPLHTAAPTKAIMAYLPETQLEDLLRSMKFTRFNVRTVTNVTDFRNVLKDVRLCGYAVDRAEQIGGVNCIGAPIFDQNGYPIASIWTTGPSDRIPESSFGELGRQIKKFASEISQRLGHDLLKCKNVSV